MLIDLIANNNRGSYNISIARLFGLEGAVYLDVLIDITHKALLKNKVNENFILVDRDYIESITTLSWISQLNLDKRFMELGFMEKRIDGSLFLDISALVSMIMLDNEKLNTNVKDIMTKVEKASKSNRKVAHHDVLKTHISTSNDELRAAYNEWIDSVVAKEGWMSVTAITSAQEVVDRASNRNLDVALSIIKIASLNGYRDMNWAVTKFKENVSTYYNNRISNQIDYSNSKVMEVF